MNDQVPTRQRKRGADPETEETQKVEKSVLESGELGAFMAQAGKLHGPNVIRAAELRPRFKHIPTGIFNLDLALHGGFPESAISLIYGHEASGKTTLSMRVLGAAQRKHPDKAVVFLDLEGTYQPDWGETHGVDNSRMLLIQPESGEMALDLARGAIKAAETACVVVDSIAAITPMKEMQKSMEDLTVGEAGKLMSRFCRTLQQDLLNERTRGHRPAMLWINQFREKIGVMYGSPNTLPGGKAQHYAATTKVWIKNKEVMGKDQFGSQIVDYNEHAFKVEKSKIGVGVREGEFKMIRNPDHFAGAGFIDDAKDVVNWARKTGQITGAGSSWSVEGVDTKFGRLQEIADYFYSDEGFFEHFRQRLIQDYRAYCGLQPEYL